MAARPGLEILWTTRDPAALSARLRRYGLEVGADGLLAFPSAALRLISAPGRDDRLAVVNDAGDAPGESPNEVQDVLAVGWATVERERIVAAASAGGRSGLVDVQPLPDDPHLGAYVLRIGRTTPTRLVIEPETEGRLSATLARVGEGPVAIYLSSGPGGLAGFAARARAGGALVSSVRTGPLGPSIILPGGPIWGPHILVVGAAE